MDTWILVADELHAALLVQSPVGSLHEIECWDCQNNNRMKFAGAIARGIESLQTDFDQLVVAAPASLLEDLSVAFGASLNGKIAAELARDLSNLTSKQLRSQLQDLALV